MDRSFFRRSSNSRDRSPLLPIHSSSLPLKDLPPRPYSDDITSKASSSNSQTSETPSSKRSPRLQQQREHVHFSVPPPIATSVILHAPKAAPHQSRSAIGSLSSSRTISAPVSASANPLTALSRRERAIQSELQALLDAQSAGLLQGRTGVPDADDRSSDAGSSTPTSRSAALSNGDGSQWRAGSRDGGDTSKLVIPVRQPARKKIGLRGARRGIFNAILELSYVKAHQTDIINSEIRSLEAALSQVIRMRTQLGAFDKALRAIDNGAESREVSELMNEKSAVETEIRDLEDRLLGLRARERNLSSRIEELDNRKEARNSSFKNGRAELEGEIKLFLKRPPIRDTVSDIIARGNVEGQDGDDDGSQAFLILPPKRRTLEMAHSWLERSISSLQAYKSSTVLEQSALDSGAKLWEETLELVSDFENDLRQQIKDGNGNLDLKKQVGKMGVVLKELEARALVAGKEGWNLLICAVGAELEAFREGEAILRGALENIHGAEEQDLIIDDGTNSDPQTTQFGQLEDKGDEGTHDLNGDQNEDVQPEPSESSRKSTSREYRSESEDEGPDPALLFSKEEEEDDDA